MQQLRQRAIEGLAVGDEFVVTRIFTTDEILQFAHLSRDYNPVHLDEPYARLRNFKAPVSHGLLTASLLTEIGGQIGWLASDVPLQAAGLCRRDSFLPLDHR